MLQGNSPKCPRGSFSFWEKSSCSILWLPPYKKGLTSHTAHLSSSARGCPGQDHTDPTFNSPQPAPAVSVGFPLHPYSPPCDFRQPGLSQCCSCLVWQWRGPLTRLSPRGPAAGPAQVGLGLQPPWSPCWSQGRFCLEAIPLPSVFSVSSVLFGLLSSKTVGCFWLFVLFISRVGRCFTQAQGEVNSAPTYLAAIFSLSGLLFDLIVCFLVSKF